MIGKIRDLTFTANGKQIISLELASDFRDQYNDLSGKDLEISIKEYRPKRSKDANAYMWTLCALIGDKLGIPSLDVYRQSLKELNVYRDVVVNEEAASTVIYAWGLNGLGWQAESLFTSRGFTTVRLWYGSSVYNSKQMAKLIDNLISDCNDLEIAVKDPIEITTLIAEWSKKHD